MLIISTLKAVVNYFLMQQPISRLQPVPGNHPLPVSEQLPARGQQFSANASVPNAHQHYVNVYLVFDATLQRRHTDFVNFFGQNIKVLEERIAIKPIFFKEDKAIQYMRFINSGHCILSAYVPECAIEGHFDELSLKKGYLSLTLIHGCYPSYGNGEEYIHNPNFDTQILSHVRQHEDPL